ncbi:endonuclease III [uncultured Cytophaga sp.]|uniref:endonuclease III n=1 Tax=uncultured Cytophaga sp. TaxID=160238 RepID=UPI00261ABD92|nr:endonuclease III [uncultured Cytophaga sp.]
MLRKERFERFLSYFSTHSPEPETELVYTNPYELLVAVSLSAQCTDKRVNLTTPALFNRFPDAYALSQATVEEVFGYIRSISYPNNKAKHLVGMAQLLINDYKGEIPDTVEELIKLPGVGRKTANVIASVIWHQPTMAVDTHVYRVSRRIGLVPQTATTPLAVEKHLMKYIPTDLVYKSHHWLILHGRYTCLARTPKCEICPLTDICMYYAKKIKAEK